jgi:hypothetical protein
MNEELNPAPGTRCENCAILITQDEYEKRNGLCKECAKPTRLSQLNKEELQEIIGALDAHVDYWEYESRKFLGRLDSAPDETTEADQHYKIGHRLLYEALREARRKGLKI